MPAAAGITGARHGLAPSIGAWPPALHAPVFVAEPAMPETRNKELETHV